MDKLDDIKFKNKIDSDDVYESIIFYPKQIEHAWEDFDNISVPKNYDGKYNGIVFCGMGGSGLGGRVIKSVFENSLDIPIYTVHDYNLPAWVNGKTLVICSSFSGTTEETLDNFKDAHSRGAKIMAIGSGGKLIDKARENKYPYFEIKPVYNPAKHPRLAICYSIIGQMMLIEKAGINIIDEEKIFEITRMMSEIVEKQKIEVESKINKAKIAAKELVGTSVAFIASRHLVGSAHVIKNQLNENAKNFGDIFEIPELNHHLLEGLMYPEDGKKLLSFLFFESSIYGERILKRYSITKKILDKYDIKHISIELKSNEKLLQAFEAIQTGGFINYYMGLLNKVNPGPIPWVDYFKKSLGQSLGQWK